VKTKPSAGAKSSVCRLAVIGGSGLADLSGLTQRRSLRVKTPFGPPSGPIVIGELNGVSCAFLARHGVGHVLLPSEINYRANIWALKSIGVESVIAVTAVGSLKEELPPLHFVFPDQTFDKTVSRAGSFFGQGCVAHTSVAEPFCSRLSRALCDRSSALGIASHFGGTYVCMEGPAFSTRAESEFHRQSGFSIIGMTACPEAKLSREAGLCYGLVSLVTDYDCWKKEDVVSAGKVMETMKANSENARRLITAAVSDMSNLSRDCGCSRALDGAIVTAAEFIPPATRRRVAFLTKGNGLPPKDMGSKP
jgi:5'-methylthioadenosine phosphorylase